MVTGDRKEIFDTSQMEDVKNIGIVIFYKVVLQQGDTDLMLAYPFQPSLKSICKILD